VAGDGVSKAGGGQPCVYDLGTEARVDDEAALPAQREIGMSGTCGGIGMQTTWLSQRKKKMQMVCCGQTSNLRLSHVRGRRGTRGWGEV
jgi:hypothetical protein